LNSNTADRHRRRRPRRRGAPADRARRPQTDHSHRQSAKEFALQPVACDVAPIPFTSLSLDPRLLEGIRDLGFKETRPIQSAVIPLAIEGNDLIACAETGTGKTCAFVVPTLQRLLTGQLGAPQES
jgi:superfamily II DNA/RNA helicase